MVTSSISAIICGDVHDKNSLVGNSLNANTMRYIVVMSGVVGCSISK